MITSRALAPEAAKSPLLTAGFDRDFAKPAAAVGKKPDFFLVGAPKCGTTAMAEYLGEHPDIFMARKEMHVFGEDLRFSTQFFRRNLPEYLAEFEAWNGQPCAGEASVWYLFSTQAAAEIKAFNPEARIIIMLRNPADMLYSLYHQFRYDGNEHLADFAQALAAESERREGQAITRQTYFIQGLVYRETARFANQVRRYLEVFGRERVHVIIYDDFAIDPDTAYRDTLGFLGVDAPRTKPVFSVVNGNKSVKNPVLRAVLNDRFVRRSALAVRPYLPRRFFDALQKTDAWLRRLNTRPAKRSPVPSELGAQLKREFATDVEQLSALLGRDLTHWSR